MNVSYKFKGRLLFETTAEAQKYWSELVTNVYSVFWRINLDYGLRSVYPQGKKLRFDFESYGSSHQLYETVEMVKKMAIVARSGRVRIYEDDEFQEIIPSSLRQKKKKLDEYSAYLESLGKDVLDSKKSSYEKFLKLKMEDKFNN